MLSFSSRAFRRGLTLLVAAPLAAAPLVVAAPAANALVPACGLGAEVLAEFDVLGGNHTRIATEEVSATEQRYCLQVLGTTQLVLVVKSGLGVTPPAITQTTGAGTCATRIIDMTAPVQLSLSVGATASPAVCYGKDGVTTTIAFTGASVQSIPDVDVYFPRLSTLTDAWCLDVYTLYVLGERTYDQWYACYASDHQIL